MLLAVKMTGSRRGRRSPPLQRFAGENGMDGAHGAKHVGGMNAFTWWHDAISRRGTQAAQRFLPVASSRMKTRILSWLVLGCLAGAGAWAAPLPGRTPHIDDTVHLLPPIPGDQDALEAKLAEFEARSGIKILVEFRERSPAADEDKVPGAYMRALSGREGTLCRQARHGAAADRERRDPRGEGGAADRRERAGGCGLRGVEKESAG